jgi:hypothetical protein
MTPPPYVADYRRVPIPEPQLPLDCSYDSAGRWLWRDTRPWLSEIEAPLVYGAKKHKDYRRAFLNRGLGFQVYHNTIKVIRHFEFQGKMQVKNKRGIIDAFSEKSRRRLRLAAVNAFPALTSQFVLTYPAVFPEDGRISKYHVATFLKSFRQKFKGVPYLWVLEFQRRGAPHYHLYTPLEVTEENRQWLVKTWVRIACHGHYVEGPPSREYFEKLREKYLRTATSVHEHESHFIKWDMGNGAYVCKYLEKSNQKDVPDGYLSVGRFWGSSRGLCPKPTWLEADHMTATYQDHVINPVTRAVRVLTKYYQNVTSWWERDNDLLYRKRKGRNYNGASIYSFQVINGKRIFMEVSKWYDRCEKGRSNFKKWSTHVQQSLSGSLLQSTEEAACQI